MAESQERLRLFALAQTDLAIRDYFLSLYDKMVRQIAYKFRDSGEPMEDLVLEGWVGLVDAFNRFDPLKGIRFSTFATETIAGVIRHYLRDCCWWVKAPRKMKDLITKISWAEQSLIQDGFLSPTCSQIAKSLKIDEGLVEEARQFHYLATHKVSLSAKRYSNDGEEEDEIEIGAIDPGFEKYGIAEWLEKGLNSLDKRSQQVIELHIFQQVTQTEIANILGCSQMHVSRIHRRALAKLKEFFIADAEILQ